MTERELIEAIRADSLVGRGSCSSVDECYDDADLWPAFGPPSGRSTIAEALEAARDASELFLERACDARWGEDDDPQLTELTEWRARRSGTRE